MSRRVLFAAAAISLASCGGGSGGSVAPAPSIESSKVALTQLPAGCKTQFVACILESSPHIDAAGEITAFCAEVPVEGTSRLAAANVAPGGNVTLSSGSIETGFAPPAQTRIVRPLGNRTFAIMAWRAPSAVAADTVRLIAKFSGGTWSTVQLPYIAPKVRPMAVNAMAQGALLGSRPFCGQVQCEELAAYRF